MEPMSIDSGDPHMADSSSSLQVQEGVQPPMKDSNSEMNKASQFDQRDLLKVFPQLAANIEKGLYSGERRDAILSFKSTRAGKVSIKGCPGAGKSTLAVAICDAIMGHPFFPKAGWGSSANVNGAADAKEDDPLSDQHDDLTEDKSGVIVWSAPRNAQVVDAVQRLKSTAGDRLIVRVFPFDNELEALLSPECIAPDYIDTSKMMPGSSNRVIVDTCHESVHQRHEGTCPSSDMDSLSSLCRAKITQNPGQYQDMVDCWLEYKKNQTLDIVNEKRYRNSAKQFLLEILRQASGICGTPFALSSLAQHTKDFEWKPSFIVVDEVDRMTELMSMVPIAPWADVPVLFIGDVQRFGLFTPAQHDEAYNSLFIEQRGMSPQRLDTMSSADFVLHDNFRAHGKVHEWPNLYFYKGKMTIMTWKSRSIRTLFHWMKSQVLASNPTHGMFTSSMFLMDLKDGVEQAVGTSYTNPINARFVVEFAAFMARQAPIWDTASVEENVNRKATNFPRGKILIITGYSQQKTLIQHLISQLCVAEVPADMISVRTIDDSPSHQAEVVLCDLVRTSGPGFLNDSKRMAVLTTRARLMTILVGQHEQMGSWGYMFRNLLDFLKKNGGIVKVSQWHLFCDNCLSPGHSRQTCPTQPVCRICGENHAGRYCPEEQVPPPSLSTPVEDIDNVVREYLPFREPPQDKKQRSRAEKRNGKKRAPTKVQMISKRQQTAAGHSNVVTHGPEEEADEDQVEQDQ